MGFQCRATVTSALRREAKLSHAELHCQALSLAARKKLGLIKRARMADGTSRLAITDDALPLLPKTMQAAAARNPKTLRVVHTRFSPHNFPSRLVGSYDYESPFDRLKFVAGKPIKEITLVPTFRFSAQRWRLQKFDVLPNALLVPLISPRAASLLLEICPDDIQLIPANIHTRDGPINDYFLLNVVKEISGMDHANSIFFYLPGTKDLLGVDKLRYLDGAMNGYHIARERELHSYLWVADSVVQRFSKEKIKGCEFVPPEAIHPQAVFLN